MDLLPFLFAKFFPDLVKTKAVKIFNFRKSLDISRQVLFYLGINFFDSRDISFRKKFRVYLDD